MHPGLLDRDFTAPAPNQRWVADSTCVRTWAGFAYVSFVIDCYSRAIVGWHASMTKTTPLVATALRMGTWRRQHVGQDLAGLTHHSDRGARYRAARYAERLAERDAVASVRSKGDSYGNAMAEALNSLDKAELVRNLGPWQSINDLEITTAEWADWWNERRLDGELDQRPPAEVETDHWATKPPEYSLPETR